MAPLALALVLLGALSLACASTPGGDASGFRFFGSADRDSDPWFDKVDRWQERERSELATLPEPVSLRESAPRSNQLRVKMGLWRAEERLSLAKRVASWAQGESRRHYRADPPTTQADDPWPTTKDLLDKNGDDCDGLDLIAYKLLRSFGFPQEQLFRAIVRRDRDRANHMVTLWFEHPEDPWVVDSTGAVTLKVRRFSDLPGWTPTKVFNDSQQFTPVRVGRNAFARAR